MEKIDLLNKTIEKDPRIISSCNYDLELGQKELSNILQDVIDRGADYVIKSLPCADAYKDILIDVKENLKTKGFKDLLKTIVGSTVREGLEIIGIPESSIRNLTGVEKVAEKGGLSLTLGAAIGVAESDLLKNRIMGDYVNDFFNRLKDYVLSNKFLDKVRSSVNRYDIKSNNFIEKCAAWYKEYDKSNLEGMLELSNSLSKNITNVRNNSECKNEYDIINNLTKCFIEKNRIPTKTDINIMKNL